MQDHTTVYQAELEAIYLACKYMDDNHEEIKPKYVKILTDSQAALKAQESIDFISTIALKTAEALENLNWRVKGCTIAWVKVHTADEATKAGTENKHRNIPLVKTRSQVKSPNLK